MARSSDEPPLERLLDGMGVPKTTTDNRVKLVPSGEDAFVALLKLIADARGESQAKRLSSRLGFT